MHPTSRATKAVTDGWIALEDEKGEGEERGDDAAMLALFEEEEDGDTYLESKVTRQMRSLSFFRPKKHATILCATLPIYFSTLMPGDDVGDWW